MIMGVPPKISEYSVPPLISAPPLICIPPPIPTPAQKMSRTRTLPVSPRVLAMAGLLVFIVLAYYAITGPSRSLRNLQSAMDRRDRETVARYVDADQLAQSMQTAFMEV